MRSGFLINSPLTSTAAVSGLMPRLSSRSATLVPGSISSPLPFSRIFMASLQSLAFGAKYGAALGDQNLLHGCRATQAGFAATAIGPQILLVAAMGAVQAPIIPEGRTALAQSLVQYRLDRLEEFVDLRERDAFQGL